MADENPIQKLAAAQREFEAIVEAETQEGRYLADENNRLKNMMAALVDLYGTINEVRGKTLVIPKSVIERRGAMQDFVLQIGVSEDAYAFQLTPMDPRKGFDQEDVDDPNIPRY